MKSTLYILLLAACFAVGPSLFAQDSSDQPLGDVVRKDQAQAKPKAKVTLDEDNTQPASASTTSDSAAGSGSSANNGNQDQNAATAGTQDSQGGQASDKPSREDQLKELDRKEGDLNASMSELQDKIDHSDATEETKKIWREAMDMGRAQMADIQKQKEALKSPQGQNAAPASAQQPASNPQQ
jgi:chromosome segregation ATPase